MVGGVWVREGVWGLGRGWEFDGAGGEVKGWGGWWDLGRRVFWEFAGFGRFGCGVEEVLGGIWRVQWDCGIWRKDGWGLTS